MIPDELEYTLEAVECPVERQKFIDDWHAMNDEQQEKILSVIRLGNWKDAVYARRQKQLGIDED